MIEQIILRGVRYGPYLVIILTVAWLLNNKYGGRLNKIPGPWLAGFTDLWRLAVTWKRRPELAHIQLHEKYGPIVRLGPRVLSVSDPEAIKVIYGLNSGFVKSEFYPVQQAIAKGIPLRSMFNSTDEKFHAKLRRAVSNSYAMSTLVGFEPLVDSTTIEFLQQLKLRYADKSGPSGVCDFGEWLQFYAFDVIGELTYSKRLGFVDNGIDVDHIISNLEWLLNYASVVGQLPILDRLFLKNPVRLLLSKYGFIASTSPVSKFAAKRMADRQEFHTVPSEHEKSTATQSQGRDFLTRFIEANKKDPEFISNERVLALTVANMFAGSDTTAITLRAVFYYLLRNPSMLQKLEDELSSEAAAGHFTRSDRLVRWDEVRQLPYLSAVIKEALRVHPAVGLTLERIVPPNGVMLAGRHFVPGGTIVGCSAWTIHRNQGIFGTDANSFRPERWIEADPVKANEMSNFLFSFGAGSRTCIGRNISYLELYKLVPAVLRTFELQLVNPEQEWHLHNAWFVKQSNFKVRFKSRS